MAIYSFICQLCGARSGIEGTFGNPPQSPYCTCGTVMRRDWQADNPQPLVVGLKREREANGTAGMQDLFLPGNKDFARPEDPDGTKGMREWRDRHEPSSGNKRPAWPGSVERKVF